MAVRGRQSVTVAEAHIGAARGSNLLGLLPLTLHRTTRGVWRGDVSRAWPCRARGIEIADFVVAKYPLLNFEQPYFRACGSCGFRPVAWRA